MHMMSHHQTPSSLNPYAPIFVPMAYRAVEDFSDQWWELVHSSPSFRDYWLRECFHDPQTDSLSPDFDDLFLPDSDALFDSYLKKQEEEEEEEEEEVEEEKKQQRDLISLAALRWSKPRAIEAPRYFDKAPKIVNVKVSPRTIHQPR